MGNESTATWYVTPMTLGFDQLADLSGSVCCSWWSNSWQNWGLGVHGASHYSQMGRQLWHIPCYPCYVPVKSLLKLTSVLQLFLKEPVCNTQYCLSSFSVLNIIQYSSYTSETRQNVACVDKKISILKKHCILLDNIIKTIFPAEITLSLSHMLPVTSPHLFIFCVGSRFFSLSLSLWTAASPWLILFLMPSLSSYS